MRIALLLGDVDSSAASVFGLKQGKRVVLFLCFSLGALATGMPLKFFMINDHKLLFVITLTFQTSPPFQ